MSARPDSRREREHFTALLAQTGDVWWGSRTPAGLLRNEKKISLFRDLARPRAGERLLELGCGTGEFTERLRRLGPSVLAFDVTEGCVGRARRAAPAASLFVADALSLPLPDGAVDLCFGVSILHHLDLARAWPEIVRVCRDGARVFFSEPNMLNPLILLEKNVPWLRRRLQDSPDETAFVRGPLRRLLAAVGGAAVEVRNIDFLHPLVPERWLGAAEKASDFLERVPLLREISGSLAIFGTIRKDG